MLEVIINGYTGETVDVGNVSHVHMYEETAFGLFTVLFSIASLVLYSTLIYYIYSDKDYKDNDSQRIMVHIGVTDCSQLVIHLLSGGYLLFHYESYGWVAQIQGAFMNGMWCTGLFLRGFLALNRLVSIVLFMWSRVLVTPFVCTIALLFCWFWSVLIVAFNLTGLSVFVYVIPWYTWQYVAGHSLGGILREFSNTLILGEVLVSAVSYFIIFLFVFMHKGKSSHKELILTLQVSLISGYSIFGYCIWTFVPVMEDPMSMFLSNFIWLLWNSINPFIIIALNKRVRNRIIHRKTSRMIVVEARSAVPKFAKDAVHTSGHHNQITH